MEHPKNVLQLIVNERYNQRHIFNKNPFMNNFKSFYSVKP